MKPIQFLTKATIPICFAMLLCVACKQEIAVPNATAYITSMDQSRILQPLPGDSLQPSDETSAVIVLDTTTKYQEMDGFGYTLTGAAPCSCNG